MFRRIEDFLVGYRYESQSTLKLLDQLTDASLLQKVTPDGRSLGQLAWHITLTLGEMLGRTGLSPACPGQDAAVPASVREIRETYARASSSALEQIEAQWTDTMLDEMLDMYGQQWRRGAALAAFTAHEAHHRGQMTVLMRQAGLKVPGVYGPAREEWAEFHQPAPW
ncbi:MAG: DinB family protein [Candidatus Eisenbacteria bacterium]|nr:DinB family protein [Candidatus Eisenbacteria bacterium]